MNLQPSCGRAGLPVREKMGAHLFVSSYPERSLSAPGHYETVVPGVSAQLCGGWCGNDAVREGSVPSPGEARLETGAAGHVSSC